MYLYLIIGAIYGFLVTFANEESIKKGAPIEQRFNLFEGIVIILLWPFYVAMFIYYLLGGDRD
jgi:hypothetical protein